MRKRVVIIFSILIFFVLLIVLFSTLFNMSSIEVSFKNQKIYELNKDDIIKSVTRYKGKNLLFLSEKEVSATVSESSSYIGSVEIERKFPNTIILHVTEREEAFAVKLSDASGSEKYYIFDRYGYLLRSSESYTDNMGSENAKELVLIEGIKNEDVISKEFGKKLNINNVSYVNCISTIFDTLTRIQPPYLVHEIKDLVKTIDMSDLRKVTVIMQNKLKIVLRDADLAVDTQINVAMAAYHDIIKKNEGELPNVTISLILNSQTGKHEAVVSGLS